MHIHISSPNGEAKFWLEPIIALAYHFQLSGQELRELQKIIEERKDEITNEWRKHFGS